MKESSIVHSHETKKPHRFFKVMLQRTSGTTRYMHFVKPGFHIIVSDGDVPASTGA